MVARILPWAAALSAIHGAEAVKGRTHFLAVTHTDGAGRGIASNSEITSKNPIRKVVQLLEGMAKKISDEGDKEADLYKKFNCYCQTGAADLQESIAGNDAKVPSLKSDIEEAESSSAKLKEDLKQHAIDRDSANKAMQEATALREKESAKFVAESTEIKSYVDALARAIPAIMKGMTGTGLLQSTSSATVTILHKAANGDTQLTEDDRSTVAAFLSGSSVEGYIPKSGEITGILTTMKEDFDKDLAGITATDEEAHKLFEELIAAKTKEVNALGASIEKKTARVGDLQVEIVQMKSQLTEAEALLISDQEFLADMDKNCEGKAKEMEERRQMRADELVAIHETIKILNDDDALDLFKKTLPSASFLQMAEGNRLLRKKALAALRGPASSDKPEARFLEIALEGGKVDFAKVVKMIDDMVNLLKQEQEDDDFKREYCGKQIDTVEDKGKTLEKKIDDTEIALEDKTEMIGTLSEEIKTLHAEVDELDKLVMEATEQRKKENEAFTQLMAENSQAKELLEYAKNRLNKFYNPSLYKEAPKQDDEEAAVLLQKVSKHGAAPGDAPETWSGDYKQKGEETGGVVSMIDLLVRDLTKEMTIAETDEDNGQKEYEGFMQDSAGKRAKSVKSINIKESAKADSEMMKTSHEGDLKVDNDKLMVIKTYEMQLHTECDWLLQNYDLRKTARADEADNLKQAKAILKGADFALLQWQGFRGAHRA